MAATTGSREINYPHGWELCFTQVGETRAYQTTGCVYDLFEQNGDDAESARNASAVVLRLLDENADLVRTFDVEPANALTEQLLESRYLAINGLAVCIFNRVVPDRVNSGVRDSFFTRAILLEPIQCSGVRFGPHNVELKLLRKWMAVKGATSCPCGAAIDEARIFVDEDRAFECDQAREKLEARITGAKRECVHVDDRAEQHRLRQVLEREETRKREVAEFLERLQIATRKKDVEFTYAGGKILFKGAGSLAARYVAKNAAKEAVRKGAKTAAAKLIPGVSVVIGVGLGIGRIMDGEIGKGVLEMGSGVVACVPGYGPALSAAADVGIAALDYSDYQKELAKEKPESEVEQQLLIDPSNAYDILFGMAKEDCLTFLRPLGMKNKVKALRLAFSGDKGMQSKLSNYQVRRFAEIHKLKDELKTNDSMNA